MFFQARGNRQDVWIKNNIASWEICPFRQQIVSPRTDVDFALETIGLSSLIECHDDRSRSVAPDQPRLTKKLFFAVFEADGIHDGLSLHAFEAGFDYRPL
jgi:hypothetical protein